MNKTTGLLAAAVAAGGALAWLARDLPGGMRGAPSGDRLERIKRSPHYRDGTFHNSMHTRTMLPEAGRLTVRELITETRLRKPAAPIPVVTPQSGGGGADALHITWYGHATALIEIEGRRVLVDPVWSDRCSPSRLAGPKRLHPMPVPIDALPRIDSILISHDHYDHLDMPTVRALLRTQQAPFLVPLGVGSYLERWGVPTERIIELDWEDSAEVDGITFVATEARHFSGRAFKRNITLWSSWVIAGATKRVFYTGDSGYFGGYAEIGAKHGPFDATLMQIGAYHMAWPEIHMYPEEAVQAHHDVRGGLMIPVHWASFVLSTHPWGEPVDRVWREAKTQDARLYVPRPGELVDVSAPLVVDPWWQPLAASAQVTPA